MLKKICKKYVFHGEALLLPENICDLSLDAIHKSVNFSYNRLFCPGFSKHFFFFKKEEIKNIYPA